MASRFRNLDLLINKEEIQLIKIEDIIVEEQSRKYFDPVSLESLAK